MLYPENRFETKLNFDQIKSWLEEECLCIMGKELVQSLDFVSDSKTIERQQEQNKIFKELLERDGMYPNIFFEDIRPKLKKATIPNAFLEPIDFAEILSALNLYIQWKEFFEEDELNDYQCLKFEFDESIDIQYLVDEIDSVIDHKENVKDSASENLREIRREISDLESRVRRSMQKVYKQSKDNDYLSEQKEITIRNGRLVIPFAVENKRAIKGYVHDYSSSGQTAFVEPAEVFEMNNDLQDLFAEEKKEIVRILANLTNTLRPEIDNIHRIIRFLAVMDFIRAKGKLSLKIKAGFPSISKDKNLNLINAYHPVLYVHHKEAGKSVIPLSLSLNTDNRILIISGPNAGGKSVALKTIGLIFYMFQSGLPVSASDESEIPLFKDIFIDIGDEQSIENDLSTYSSHLRNMNEMLKYVNSNSLILIDEFGTGTDPQFGGAIAESILKELNNSRCFGMINTHYSNLKVFAENEIGLVNGAMLFDLENLEPLYKMEMGKPGSSYAFEVAEKIGLPSKVLNNAKDKIGYSQIEYDKMLSELENEKRGLEELNRKLSGKDANLNKVSEEYYALKRKLEEQRKEIINDAKKEAAGIVKGANRRIEKTIREIKESKADKEKTKTSRKALESYLDNTAKTSTMKIARKPDNKIVHDHKATIEIGDRVEIIDTGAKAEVLNIKNREAEIAIGNIRSFVKLNKLKKIEAVKRKTSNSSSYHTVNQFSAGLAESNLDLRGKRVDEALAEVDRVIDRALVGGLGELRILHGKGDGILRKAIRDHIKSYPQIEKYESEHVERGGDGITLVYFK